MKLSRIRKYLSIYYSGRKRAINPTLHYGPTHTVHNHAPRNSVKVEQTGDHSVAVAPINITERADSDISMRSASPFDDSGQSPTMDYPNSPANSENMGARAPQNHVPTRQQSREPAARMPWPALVRSEGRVNLNLVGYSDDEGSGNEEPASRRADGSPGAVHGESTPLRASQAPLAARSDSRAASDRVTLDEQVPRGTSLQCLCICP